jgi:hypothetical protein
MEVDDGAPGPFVVFSGGGEGWGLVGHFFGCGEVGTLGMCGCDVGYS